MHFLAIAAGGIRTALFSSGPPSLSFSGPSEMPGLPSFCGHVCGRLSLKAKPDPKRSTKKGKTDGADPRPKKKKNQKKNKKKGGAMVFQGDLI
jgi:hypothetical protein